MYKNNQLQTLLIISSIITITYQCQQGCLVCDYPNCQVCDFQNHYFLKDGICTQNHIEFCQILSIEGNCLQCDQDHLLNNNACINKISQQNVENCKYYDINLNCVQCRYGYFLKEELCQKLQQVIENCEIQETENICLECFDGYHLYENQCQEKKLNQNCKIYSNKTCKNCNDGYFYESNTLKQELIQNAYKRDYFNLFKLIQKDFIPNYQQCKLITIENCQEFDTFNSCKKCKQGYFLKDKVCFRQPYEIINNCQVQQNYTQCQKCQKGYHLTQEQQCIINQKIDNCIEFAQDTLKTTCVLCQDDFYVDQNKCEQRNFTQNCILYNSHSNTCKQCQENYQLIENDTKCILQIQDCKFSIVQQGAHLCKQCNDHFYLQNNTCLPGYIENCIQYINDKQCDKCEEGFYLNEFGFCIQHDIIKDCQQYHNSEQNICLKCKDDQLIINTRNSCQKNETINCKQVDNDGKCLQCQDGFNLVADNLCEMIDESSNCKNQIYNQCIKCKEIYELQEGQCLAPNSLINVNCENLHIKNTINEEKSHCVTCDSNNFPYFYDYIFHCQDVDINDMIENCTEYQKIQGVLKCIKCREQFVVSVEGNCVSNCEPGQLQKLGNFINDIKNYQYIDQVHCIEDNSIEGCTIVNHFVDQNNKIYQKCVKCSDDFLQIINNDLLLTPINQEYQFEVQCVQKSNQNQHFCQYYAKLNVDNYKCLKCHQNYTGILQQYKQQNCIQQEQYTYECIQCSIGYALIDGSCQLMNQANIPNCQTYSFQDDICYKCNNGYILDLAQQNCIKIDVDVNCDIYDQNNKKCLLCYENYIFDFKLNKCVLKIPNCSYYLNINQCEQCDQQYYLNIDKNECIEGFVENCLEFEDYTGKCIKYKNQIELFTKNKCHQIQKIQNCIQYDDNQNCKLCENNYYLQEHIGKCCQLQHYGDQCEIQSENCLELQFFQDEYFCVKCKNGFYSQNGKCIQDYYYEFQGEITNQIRVETNQLNCIVFDFQTLKCQVCKLNYYLSQGYCCQEGFYFDNNICKPIQIIQDCIQIKDQQSDNIQCQKCRNGYQLIEQQCTKLPINCLTINQDGYCIQCQENFYLTDNSCCMLNSYLDQDGSCQQLTEGNLKYCAKYNQKCLECQNGYTLIDQLCIKIETMYDGCDQIEEQNIKCFKCKENYTLQNGICCQSIEQVFDIEQGACVDSNNKICESDQYITIDNNCCQNGFIYLNNSCVDPMNLSKNCLYYDEITLDCLICNNSQFYINEKKCVPNNYYLQDGIIKQIQIENCLQQQDNFCQLCKDYYILEDNQCLPFVDNCLEMNFDQQKNQFLCDKCRVNFVYNLENQQCEDNLNNMKFENCQKKLEGKCMKCIEGYYHSNNHCCKYGMYFNGFYCLEIPIDNCSVYENGNCLQCFLEDSITFSQLTYEYKSLNSQNIEKIYFLQNIDFDHYSKRYNLQNNQCCLAGHEYNSVLEVCQQNTIPNCNFQQSNTCIQCNDEYYLANNNQKCCKYNQIYENGACIYQQDQKCEQGFYISNQHCCREKFYWSLELKKCQPLIDPNCEQSNTILDCAVCALNFYPSPVYNVEIIDYIQGQQFYGKFCQNTNLQNLINQNEIKKITELCQIPNFENRFCQQCQIGSYKVGQNQRCCTNGYMLYDINQQAECVLITKFTENCQNFDTKSMVCLECDKAYHLDQNICCPLNYFYNIKNKNCDIFIQNCQILDHYTNQCQQCEQGYYYHHKNCCKYNQYYDVVDNICKDSQYCYQYNQESDVCKKCIEGYYLHNNQCCQIGSYFDGTQCIQNTQNDIQSGFAGCLIYGEQLQCLQCQDDLVETNGRCCQQNYFYDGTACQKYPENCKKIDENKNCVLCNNNSTPENEICCGKNEFYSAQVNSCRNVLFYSSCLNFDQEGCFQCDLNMIPIWNQTLNYYDCEENKFGYIDGCLRYQSDGTCKQCKNLFSLSYDYKQCIQTKEDKCKRYDYQNECRECFDGYILFEGECIQSVRNCLIFESEQKIDCLRCENYYYRDLYDFQCYQFQNVSINQKIPNCIFAHYLQQNGEENIICEQCESDYYLSNNECVFANQIQQCTQYNNQNKCSKCNEDYYIFQNIDNLVTCCFKDQFNFNQQCRSDKDFSIDNCDYYKSEVKENLLQIQCLQCQDQFYLYQNTCCPIGTYLKGSECVKSIDEALKTCLYFDDEDNCSKKYEMPCENNYYLTESKCCQYGYYYNLDTNQCEEIQIENCIQLNENLTCKKCTDSSTLYNNSCCLQNEFFDDKTQSCLQKGINCKINDQNTRQCLECQNENQHIQGQHCCTFGQYYNSTQDLCIEIDQIQNCNQGKILNETFECTKCEENFTLYDNIQCCSNETLLINDMCIDKNLLENCIQLDINSKCQKCINEYYLSSEYKICCQQNQYFDQVSKQCQDIQIQNCTQQDLFQQCKQCTKDYYLTNQNQTCCRVGQIWDGQACKDTQLDYCQEFDNSQNEIMCKKCSEGYNLYKKQNSTICCKNKYYYNELVDKDECVPFDFNIQDCLKIDSDRPVCKICLGYSSNNYCCQEQYFFSENQCQYIQNNGCLQYSDKQKLCLKCNQEYYLTNGHCCLEGKYYDQLSQKCEDISSSNRYAYCLQVENDNCTKCISQYHLLDGHCYSYGFVSEDINIPRSLDQCSNLFVFEDKIMCQNCIQNYNLADNKESCCLENQIVQQGQCKEQIYVPENCRKWDPINFECELCDETNSYIISGKCIQYGYFIDQQENQKKIDQPHCIEYESIQNKCTKCLNMYYLDDSFLCKDVPEDCLKYNQEKHICDICREGFYLSDSRCCKEGFQNIQGECIQIQQEQNCLQIVDNICIKCVNDFELQSNNCCKRGYYYSNNSKSCLESHIQNCKNFDFEGNCLICFNGYMLVNNKLGQQICLQIPIEFCQKAELLTEINNIKCIECQNHNTEYIIQEESKQIIYDIGQIPIGCEYIQIEQDITQSTFKCLKCTDNNSNYVNEDGICVLRKKSQGCKQIDNNFIYDIDGCKACVDNYYLAQNECHQIKQENCTKIINEQCIQCEESYQLLWKKTDQTLISSCYQLQGNSQQYEDNPFFIEQCSNLYNQCTGQKYTNTPDYFEQIYNCQICQENYVPIANGKFTKDGVQIAKLDDSYNNSSGCIETQRINNIQNCAFYLNSYDKEQEIITVSCLACKPGYRGVRNSENKEVVEKCEIIQNCKNSGNILEGCFDCENVYVLQQIDGKIDYSNCIYQNENFDNCKLIDENETCVLCNDGYFLTENSQCLMQEIQSCNQGLQNSQISNFSYSNFTKNTQNGCLQCQDYQIPVLFNYQNHVCLYTTNIDYETNCEKFGVNQGQEICQQCKEGYIQTNSIYCVQKNKNLDNCILADSENQCLQCGQNYIPIFGQCQEKNIQNCDLYDLQDKTKQLCIQCNEYYYLEDNSCQLGQIQNCLRYQEKNCVQCQQEFVLIRGQNGFYQCIKIEEDDHCINYSQNDLTSDISCTQCEDGFYISQAYNKQTSMCQQFNDIPYCIQYEENIHLPDSQFNCKLCNEQYYLERNQCKERKNDYQNCQDRSKTNDQCDVCIEGFFYDTETLNCVANNTGIQNCIEYETETQCKQCKNQYYLYQNKCLKVEDQNIVQNCTNYNNLQKCQLCEDFYYLDNDLCIENDIQYCLKQYNNTCLQCIQQYYIDSSQNCQKIDQIDNCKKQDLNQKRKCIQCSNNYYPFEDNCLQVTDQIENCENYGINMQCQKCLQSYYLNFLGQCLKNNEQMYCENLIETNNQCILCKSGYRLTAENMCVEDIDGSQMEGCFLGDDKDPGICLICKTGYYHDKNYICQKSDFYQMRGQNSDVQNHEYYFVFSIKSLMLIFIFDQLIFFAQFSNQFFQFFKFLF